MGACQPHKTRPGCGVLQPLEDENSRVLEVPLWMLDVAACSKTAVSKLAFVSADSLRELKEILESARLGAQLPRTPETQHQYLQDAKRAEDGTADLTETEATSVVCSPPVQSALGRPVARHSAEDDAAAGAVTQAASKDSGRRRNRTGAVR
jgi:hypothetical protein